MTAFHEIDLHRATPSSSASFSPYPMLYTHQCNQASQTVGFECQHCDSRLTSKTLLKHHESLHRVTYDCVWSGCSHRFSNKSDYKRHMNAHTTERFLPCAYCHKSCDHREHYKKHVKKHIEKPLFTCCHCPIKFAQRAQMRKHERSHSNVKFVHLYEPQTKADLKKLVSKSLKKVKKSFKPEIQRCKNLKDVITLESDSESDSRSENSDCRQSDSESLGGNHRNASVQLSPAVNARPTCISAVAAPVGIRRSEENRQCHVETTPSECTNSAFFKCALCKFSSNSIQQYQKHAYIHTRKTGKYICELCQAHFSVKICLLMHERRCH